MDGWKMSFLLGRPIFRGYVKLRGGRFWPWRESDFRQYPGRVFSYSSIYLVYIWSNSSDLTRPGPPKYLAFGKGNNLISGKSRLACFRQWARQKRTLKPSSEDCILSNMSTINIPGNVIKYMSIYRYTLYTFIPISTHISPFVDVHYTAPSGAGCVCRVQAEQELGFVDELPSQKPQW